MRRFVAHTKICNWKYFNRFEDEWITIRSGNIREFYAQSGNISKIEKIFRKTRESQGSRKFFISFQACDFIHTQFHTQLSMTIAKLGTFVYHLLAAKSDLKRKAVLCFMKKLGKALPNPKVVQRIDKIQIEGHKNILENQRKMSSIWL